ncbi:MAG: imelysin family protein [Pseudomonadota bacterium]
MKHAIAALLLTTGSASAAQSVFDANQAQLLQDGLIETADMFILPGYQAFAATAVAMEETTTSYCDGTENFEAVETAFADVFLAWQYISIIQIGPINDAEGPMRVQLWPDPKGFARRAIRSAVSAADPALLEDGALEGHSVALVNLTALEELIYGDFAPGTYACDLAVALSANQATLAEGLVADWTTSDFRAAFDTAAEGNATYPTIDALIRELLAGTVVYTDRLRKFKLQRGLGLTAGESRPERTEARKSGLGLQSIAVSFTALRDLYELPLGFFDVTPDVGGSMEYFVLGETAASISGSLSIERRSLAEIAEEDGVVAADLRNYAELTLFHEDYLKIGLPASLGMTAGFTSADGD